MKGLLATLSICLVATLLYDSFISDVSSGAVYIGLGALIAGSVIGTVMKYLSEKAKHS